MGSMMAGALMAAASATVAVSPQTAALIAPVRQAYAKVDAEQAALPPAKTPREKLERLLDLDQAGRAASAGIDLSKYSAAERKQTQDAIAQELDRHDRANRQALQALMPADGWFNVSVYGDKAALAAFLVVQHADDPTLQRDTLPKLKSAVDAGEASGQWYALLFDRVAVEYDHKPQRYGTQLSCVKGAWKPAKIEAPANLDVRRKQLGLKESEADYLQHFSGTCQQGR
jgi:hypothetical protein